MSPLPEYVEFAVEGAMECVPLLSFGTVSITGLNADGMAPDAVVRIEEQVDGIRIYDRWARVGGIWAQLNPVDDGSHRYHCDALYDAPVTRIRLWIGQLDGLVDHDPPPPTEEPKVRPVIPHLLDPHGAPPAAELIPWVESSTADVIMTAVLEEWGELWAEADVQGWRMGIAPGTQLLWKFASESVVDVNREDIDRVFGLWVMGLVGRELCRRFGSRRDVEQYGVLAGRVCQTLSRVVRAAADYAEIGLQMPAHVGPLERHLWIIEEDVAQRIGNPARELHRPLVLLRPLLTVDGRVVLEGMIA